MYSWLPCNLPFFVYTSQSSCYTDTAQIFIGDTNAPGILYASLPEPRDDTNIMDTPFTLIPLPENSGIEGIDYDPVNETVYWNDFNMDRISRIQLDGTNREVIVSTDCEWIAICLLRKCNFSIHFKMNFHYLFTINHSKVITNYTLRILSVIVNSNINSGSIHTTCAIRYNVLKKG